MRKSIAFDFDGVIHSYTSGWQGYDVIPDPVVPGIKEVIHQLKKMEYYIIVFSTRAMRAEGVDAMWRYLEDNEIYVDSSQYIIRLLFYIYHIFADSYNTTAFL